VGKGAKIAIGCGVAALLAIVVAVALLVGGVLWGKKQLKNAGFDSAKLSKFGELQKKINAMPFAPPADGVIPEDRFVSFLAVRKAVFPVYEQNRATLEQMRDKQHKPGLSDVVAMTGIVSSIQYARAEAMADQQLGTAEYAWMTQAVYKAHIGTRIAAATGGKGASRTVSEAMERARKEIEAERQESAKGTAEREKALDETQRRLDAAGQAAQAQAAALDVPAANLALFEKYKADIDRYAMPELALIGM
jgi:hypothetical protein